MVESTILQEFSTWASQNIAVSSIVGGVMWDTIKTYLLTPFKKEFTKYFKNEEETEEYFEKIGNSKSINTKKPYRDIEDMYETIANKKMPEELIDQLKKFLADNKDKIEMINKEKGDFTSNNQFAGRDVNNVKGSQMIINYGRD